MLPGQFLESDGWLFRRLEDGSVEIEPGESVPRADEGVRGAMVHVVSPDAWASIVAHVSSLGEDARTFRIVQDMHG